ncbi:MAG: hypothetical protein KKA62_04585 [Nanoarchaeota archaeon]|nr:hypothetical protein [Nanoarchaeota archaeon]MBU1643891.1 hypothetical protein [Nanoarchaeota archaeon]MBU1977198.1 hypothetical protein [Nanoarchaeota archaeon]
MLAYLEGLVDRKTLAIITALHSKPDQLFHLNSLAQEAKVPVTSTARIIKKLVAKSFAEEIKVGKLSLYKLADNNKNKEIGKLI